MCSMFDTYDPMEEAIFEYCEKLNISKEHMFSGEELKEYPFTNEKKMVGRLWLHDEEIILTAKGSYENIIDICELTEKEKRGLQFALIASTVYVLIFLYSIVPGLPLSGTLLDNSQLLYVDKLFSYNSFFANGFVFIVTIFFVILGSFYGIGAKKIKNQKEFVDTLGHSLDDIGKTLVLIFFASLFISV